jgi:hypothetical protein
MLSPEAGDVLIRDAITGYIVVEAISLRELSGPYLSIADAFVAAQRQVSTGRIWRENVDRRGRMLGAPFLLQLQASTLA